MKKMILVSVALFLAACSQGGGSANSKDPSKPAEPTPSQQNSSVSGDPFWKSKKAGCYTLYNSMEYYIDASFRFQSDKMLGILDIKSWDNNSPGSSYQQSYNLKCEFKEDSNNNSPLVQCKESTGGMLIAAVYLRRNPLNEVSASIYVANQWLDDGYCKVENQ